MASSRNIHIFNCDGLYDLRIVEDFLNRVESNIPFKLSVHRHVFYLHEMRRLSEEIAAMDMDYAVFVVHANESRLSINEKGAGIGYALIYTALQERTDDKVLTIIGGDDHYGGEENRAVLSDWAKYKISSQFSPEYMDGRKSFIISWKNQPNNIHYEAVKHFFSGEGVFEPPGVFPTPVPHPHPDPHRDPHPHSEPMKRHYLIIQRRIVYHSAGLDNPDQYLLEDVLNKSEDNKVLLVSIVNDTIGREMTVRECSTDTVYHSSFLYSLFYSEPSGPARFSSLLLNGECVNGETTWQIPLEIKKNLRGRYGSIPYAVVQVCDDKSIGYFYKVHYPGTSQPRKTWKARGRHVILFLLIFSGIYCVFCQIKEHDNMISQLCKLDTFNILGHLCNLYDYTSDYVMRNVLGNWFAPNDSCTIMI